MVAVLTAVLTLVWSASLVVTSLRQLTRGQIDLASKVDTALLSIGKIAERVSRIEGFCSAREHVSTYSTENGD